MKMYSINLFSLVFLRENSGKLVSQKCGHPAFRNNLSELDFSISKKRVSTVKPSQEDEFFCTVMKYFF